MKSSHRCPRGFGLISMLVAMALLGAFAIVAGQLFVTALRASGNANDAQTRTVCVDGLVRVLREDVWASRSVRSAEGQLQIDRAGQGDVCWCIDSGTVYREERVGGKTQRRTWANLGVQVEFESREAAVVLRICPDGIPARKLPEDEVFLVSQTQLAGRVSP